MSDQPASSPWVFEVTSANFEREVIERSSQTPVVVDFWAPWCGPCQMLGPLLERLAAEFEGRFVLGKVNSDQEPELARDFGVRSIPAVFAVRDGRAVDGFVGVQPETMLRDWLERLMPSPAEQLAAEAAALAEADPAAAETKYRAALALGPGLVSARVGLARLALERDQFEDAQALLAEMEREGFLEPDAEKLKAELALRLQARGAGGVASARAALAARPDDLDARFQLAEALAAAGQYDEALALCLELVERDRKGVGERARQTMLAIFQLLPAGSELVIEYQRQLSMVLMD